MDVRGLGAGGRWYFYGFECLRRWLHCNLRSMREVMEEEKKTAEEILRIFGIFKAG
ncbi:MAG: hypothetical protein V1915_00340 [Candidatus Bathyarchaeota archaeon]